MRSTGAYTSVAVLGGFVLLGIVCWMYAMHQWSQQRALTCACVSCAARQLCPRSARHMTAPHAIPTDLGACCGHTAL